MSNPVDSYDLVEVPTVAEYKAAFRACKDLYQMSTKHLEMLKAHYSATGHTVTAGELAQAVGYAGYSTANSQYGTYAAALCRALGRTPYRGIAISVLVTFSGGQPGDEFIRWTMIPQVVTALEEMRWVRRPA